MTFYIEFQGHQGFQLAPQPQRDSEGRRFWPRPGVRLSAEAIHLRRGHPLVPSSGIAPRNPGVLDAHRRLVSIS